MNLRGNVDTRLAKREAGVVEATLLALAGLKRLGMAHVGTPVPEDEMLPAVGQGAVCIECRDDDARTRGWLAAIDHAPTATCVAAEHAMLAVLDGSCRTPIAGHAILTADGSAASARPDREARRLARRSPPNGVARRAMPRPWAATPATNSSAAAGRASSRPDRGAAPRVGACVRPCDCL